MDTVTNDSGKQINFIFLFVHYFKFNSPIL